MLKSKTIRVLFSFCLLAPLSVGLVGCQEEVAEVETPNGEVELNENPDGSLDVDVDD